MRAFRSPRSDRARRWPREPELGGETTDDTFETPALRVLRAILREGPLNMRRFTEASGHAPRHAKNLRDKLVERDCISIREATVRRLTTDIEISLTAKGRKVAQHAEALETITRE